MEDDLEDEASFDQFLPSSERKSKRLSNEASPEERLERAVKNQIMRRRQTMGGGEPMESFLKTISVGTGIGMHAEMEGSPQVSRLVDGRLFKKIL
jgi:hypothetical protein